MTYEPWYLFFGWSGFGMLMRAEDIEEVLEAPAICKSCNEEINELGICDGVGSYFCESCAQATWEKLIPEAKAFAARECKLTHELPTFDPSRAWACTPEEYEAGDRESYTENAYHADCRHNYTNYDALIWGLDRDSMYDEIKHCAIKARIDEMIDDEIISKDLIRCELDDDDRDDE